MNRKTNRDEILGKIKEAQKDMKKITTILAICVIMTVLTFPIAMSASDVTVTGSFSPQSTIAISCNNTAPAFGDIALAANGTVSHLNITNDGTSDCSVTTTAAGTIGANWTLKSGTYCPSEANNYSINLYNWTEYAAWSDIYTEKTIISPLNATGNKWGEFDLRLFVGNESSTGPGAQTCYTNLTAAAIT